VTVMSFFAISSLKWKISKSFIKIGHESLSSFSGFSWMSSYRIWDFEDKINCCFRLYKFNFEKVHNLIVFCCTSCNCKKHRVIEENRHYRETDARNCLYGISLLDNDW
jgi:hypothetical protein